MVLMAYTLYAQKCHRMFVYLDYFILDSNVLNALFLRSDILGESKCFTPRNKKKIIGSLGPIDDPLVEPQYDPPES